MNMNKIIKFLLAATMVLSFNACSALKETLASQTEVPTLENQANRSAVAIALVRENHIMQKKLPISSDAKWPLLVNVDINNSIEKKLNPYIMKEPFFATDHYTKGFQRGYLGSGLLMQSFGDYSNIVAAALSSSISPLTYKAYYKISIFYGKDSSKWPDVFNFEGTFKNFLEFSKTDLALIDSPTGDVYNSLEDAFISLMPINLQKDLTFALEELNYASDDVASLEAQKGEIKTKLQDQKTPKQDLIQLNEELDQVEADLEKAKQKAEQKQEIYTQLLDTAKDALESDINLDDPNYVALAKNVNLAANSIVEGANEAYTAFSLALTNIISNNLLLNLPRELESLALATDYVPGHLRNVYAQRIKRLGKNALYLFPNIFVGIYYANQQKSVVSYYVELTDIIIEADKLKQEKIKEKKEK